MSARTPNKQRSSSKKTPVKSTGKKQQPKQLQSSTKQVPQSAKKNPNLIEQIKQQFLLKQVIDSSFSSKELLNKLKAILTVEGVETATHQLMDFIVAHNLPGQTLCQALTKLNQQSMSGLVYLIENILNKEQNIPTLNISAWIHAIFRINSELICYNEKIKQFVSFFSERQNKNNNIEIIKGKISLLTGF